MNEPLTGILEAVVYFAAVFLSVFLMIFVVAKLDTLVRWLRRKIK